MNTFQLLHLLATLFCSLVAGIVMSFSIIVMPGIKVLNDGEFLQAFKAMDRVIQQNHPLFMLIWLGSIATLLAMTWLGMSSLEEVGHALLIAACALYIIGVQLPTIAINIPLNNHLQGIDLITLNDTELADLRLNFEARWNQSNVIRTACAVFTSALLLGLFAWPASA